ncbi:MAG: hypothetical protein IT276_04025 [Ignavibacteriaceae bacterium]|nr:hypothetical protein [Ignavibacteriaceae bacterium]HRN25111.1 hypothetical protein [Ignavibacteriaceae bacterium]HRP93715.1 hypothetical protein [Ignavibacteriaceae bacterium]
MGYTTILDILGAAIIGGILLINLLRVNGGLIENESIYSHDKNLQIDLVIAATVLERDFSLLGYVKSTDQVGFNQNIFAGDSVSITFRSDIDNNGVIDTISYFISDTSALSNTPNPRDMILYRKTNSDYPFVLANNVTRFRLTYLNTFLMEVPPPIVLTTAVNYIRIEIRVEDPFAYDNKYSEAIWRRITVSTNAINRI